MSDPRDDLAALIELTEFGYDTERRPPSAWGYALADAIIEAGWRNSADPCPIVPPPPPEESLDHDW